MDSTDCDDSNNTVYTNAPELCDGIVNNCGSELSTDEIDQDGDGFVSCEIDNGGWDGVSGIIGGNDCDDNDVELAPATIEICDGRSNQCGQDTPENEIDDDGDGFVECMADPDNWFGPSIQGGMDCEDGDNSIYPTAPELCDGLINDCGNTLAVEEQDGDGDGCGMYLMKMDGWEILSSKEMTATTVMQVYTPMHQNCAMDS